MGILDRIITAGYAAWSSLAQTSGSAPEYAARISDRERYNDVAIPQPYATRDARMLGNRLTPQLLTSLIQQRNLGDLQAWVDLADEFREKNPHLQCQLSIREQSVVETRFEIAAGKGSNQRGAERAADACRQMRERWQRRETGDLARWQAEWISAIYYPVGLHEVLWARDGIETAIDGLEWVDPRRLSYATYRDDPDPWALRLWDRDGQGPFASTYGTPVSAFHPDKLLVHRPRVRGAQPPREGLFATLVWWLLFYVWDWRDLMALIEMLGKPPVIGYYSAGGARADKSVVKMNGERSATKEEKDALLRVVQLVSGTLRGMLPDTTRVEGITLPTPGANPIQIVTAQYIERLISKVVNGTATSSDLQPGARAAQESMERTSMTFWRADCRFAARREEILYARYIRANPKRFGDGCPIPVVVPQVDEPDYQAMLTRVTSARLAGLQVPRAWAHEVTGVPEPVQNRDGTTEEVLGPAAAPVAAPTPPPNHLPTNPQRQGPPVNTPESTQ